MTASSRRRRATRIGLAAGLPLVLLAGTIAVAWRAMHGLADVTLGFHGTLAFLLGLAGTAIVGGGLMFLLFYSARTGHDEAAHPAADGDDGT